MISRIKIPENRVAVLIGERGSVKRRIERELGIKIEISEGDVVIHCDDALNILTAENVVRAIGRGFSPQRALTLLKEDNALYIIPLPKNEKQLKRLRSRIIGESGRARANIERLAKVHISVHGRTVAIIGGYENVDRAREAIEKLISGFSHRSIYAMLEKKQKEIADAE